MSFTLILVGLLLVVTAIRGTYSQLFTLIKGEFTGSANFFWWAVAVLIIGSVGYFKPLQGLSRAFLVLLILVLFLTKGNPNTSGGGFFQQIWGELLAVTKTQQGLPTINPAVAGIENSFVMFNQS